MTNTALRLFGAVLAALLVNAGYLLAAREATLLNASQILLHPLLGIAALKLALFFRKRLAVTLAGDPLGPWFLASGAGLALTGIALLFLGATPATGFLLTLHLAAAALLGVLLAWRRLLAAPLLLAAAIAVGGLARPLMPSRDAPLNASLPPATMSGEAMGGSTGPFFPSAARTAHGGLIPEEFFLGSDQCGRCHGDITAQWEDSAHRFASFNNPWYRRSVEYMQDVVGVTPSKWCAGCHDHALLFSGLMDFPVAEIVDRPSASAGLACVSCHSVTRVADTMGNAGFEIEYPAMHDLAASEEPIVRWLHDLVIHLDPEPHRRAFLKPLHTGDSSAFCSSCHKVHLDEPVNHYRWLRGFNSYDNWQASGVSGAGARSFYYPEEPRTCADCHMPKVAGEDPAAPGGLVRSHRFAAANTALPTHFGRDEQLQAVRDFLRAGQVTVDIFGLVRGGPGAGMEETEGRAADALALASTFAVGEEAAVTPGRRGPAGPPGELHAPLDDALPALVPGETVRFDVVVRTRGVGHFFPSGTVDAQEAWLEFHAEDADGRTFFWSGFTGDGHGGPDRGPGDAAVDPSAHFFRSLLLDGRGNRINRRNAWAARSALYISQIPPGAAHTVRYRVRVPEDARGPVRLTARLNYRKFDWWHTQWTFRGRVAAEGEVSPDFDDRQVSFDPAIEAPAIPIVVMADATVSLPVQARSSPDGSPPPASTGTDEIQALRFNDYGIGLFLAGDLRAAESAFAEVSRLDPDFADGPVNVARVRLAEGDPDGALAALETALELSPALPRALFFRAMAKKALGEYESALDDLHRVQDSYPRDRVVNNQVGRLLFLQREYAEATQVLEKTLRIDPEDLEAHYNLMLAFQGLRDSERAARHRELYLRFKADESAQAVTGPYRRANPDDNNMRLAIHEHHSGVSGEGGR